MDSITLQQQLLIDKHLEGALTEAEAKEFDQHQLDPAFREAVALQASLLDYLHDAPARSELKSVFQNIKKKEIGHKEMPPIPTESAADHPPLPISKPTASQPTTRRLYARLAVAASLLLLMAVGFFVFSNRTPDAVHLALTNKEQILDNTLMGTSSEDEIIQTAYQAYQNKNYTKAESLLMSGILPDNSTAYFKAQNLLAHIYFDQQRFKQAIPLFATLIDQAPSDDFNKDKLRWNRLVAYLGAGQQHSETFQSELTYFKQSNSEYYRKKIQVLGL